MTERKQSKSALTFEQGLDKLEGIVEEMETGELTLDKLIAQYEKGTKLLKRCETQVKDAEQKIEMLRKRDLENPEFEDFDPDTTS